MALIGLLAASPGLAADHCKENLIFGKTSIVCSKVRLDETRIRNQIQKASELYRKATNLKRTDVGGVIVFIVEPAEINNSEKIRLARSDAPVVGRYFTPGVLGPQATIYLTTDVFKPGNTDLIHEFVHHFNYQNQITGDRDEALARRIETQYVE